jgi:hypothetical protein
LVARTPHKTDPSLPSESERLAAVKRFWVLNQLNYYIGSAYTNRISQLTFRQVGAGFLFASILISFFVAGLGIAEQFKYLNRFAALVLAFGLLAFGLGLAAVGWVHYKLKMIDMAEELREDEDELSRIERHAENRTEITKPVGVAKALRAKWLKPLCCWIGGDGPPRPNTGRLATAAFRYGWGIGLGWTIFFIFAWALACRFEPIRMVFTAKLTDWLIVAIILNVALAALVEWYTENRAFGVHYRQFRRMLAIFLLAYEELCKIEQKGGDPDAARALLKRLGREALAEHADWLLVHRDRPIELPKLEL